MQTIEKNEQQIRATLEQQYKQQLQTLEQQQSDEASTLKNNSAQAIQQIKLLFQNKRDTILKKYDTKTQKRTGKNGRLNPFQP